MLVDIDRLPVMAIERGLDGRFFIIKRPSNDGIIVIGVEIPTFDQFSAFTGFCSEEIDEDHGQNFLNLRRYKFHMPALMSPGRYST